MIGRRSYVKVNKPPYTYVSIMALAIQSSPTKTLKLCQIISRIRIMFPQMKNGNTLWGKSIRHNLSKFDCFYTGEICTKTPQVYGNV